MKREEFFEALKTFDWYYEMSDSGEVYARGKARMARLTAEADQDEDKKRILLAFCRFYNGSRLTKPTRKEFGL